MLCVCQCREKQTRRGPDCDGLLDRIDLGGHEEELFFCQTCFISRASFSELCVSLCACYKALFVNDQLGSDTKSGLISGTKLCY